MIKEIAIAGILASSMNNTTITQNIARNVYMNNTTYWLNETYIQNDEVENIFSYRNTKPQANILTSGFTIKQRSLEVYHNDPENRDTFNTYYLLMFFESEQETISLEQIQGYLNGNVNVAYPLSNNAYIEKYYDYSNLNNTTIRDFLNGTEYNTKQQYTTLINEINTRNQNLNGNQVILNDQNVGNILNNPQFYWQEEDIGNYQVLITIKIELDYLDIYDEAPITQPYTPFSNFNKEINYTSIQYETEVNPTGNGEIVDIPGLMLSILGMPFTFMAQAFNLVLFPGTIYQINVSHIFLALVGSAILIFIIKKLIK